MQGSRFKQKLNQYGTLLELTGGALFSSHLWLASKSFSPGSLPAIPVWLLSLFESYQKIAIVDLFGGAANLPQIGSTFSLISTLEENLAERDTADDLEEW